MVPVQGELLGARPGKGRGLRSSAEPLWLVVERLADEDGSSGDLGHVEDDPPRLAVTPGRERDPLHERVLFRHERVDDAMADGADGAQRQRALTSGNVMVAGSPW